jgi:hypothetical protein
LVSEIAAPAPGHNRDEHVLLLNPLLDLYDCQAEKMTDMGNALVA